MNNESSQFSAADSALGYLYQVRVALVWSLQRIKENPDLIVALETLDDVVFESQGSPAELLQTKHHCKKSASLTDSSADLWKSLRVWFAGHANGTIPVGSALHLLTTSTAPEDSIASKLGLKERKVEDALQALESVAQTSQNQDNKAAYTEFLAASLPSRRAIIESVVVFDGTPSIVEIEKDLKDAIFYSVDRIHQDTFLQYLEGWWFGRVVRQLSRKAGAEKILGVEIEAQMSDLRERFKPDSLPIDEELLDYVLDDATQQAHLDAVFVKQFHLTQAGPKRLAAAIRDYYRAFEQRSRWIRSNLLVIGDLGKYEKKLVEEWELAFEAISDELSADAADDLKAAAARQVLQWAEQTSIPIRPQVTEPFVCRGSLHMLADELKIGWHPEFRDRLAALIAKAA